MLLTNNDSLIDGIENNSLLSLKNTHSLENTHITNITVVCNSIPYMNKGHKNVYKLLQVRHSLT